MLRYVLIVVVLASLSVTHAAEVAAPPASYAQWAGVWTRVRGQDDEGQPAGVTAKVKRPPSPFRPEWLAARRQKTRADLLLENRGADCLLNGMPQMMGMVYLMETLTTPYQFMIVSEYQSSIRRIYIDGRGHPDPLWPTYNGHSIGHWEGDTLVVDTVAIKPLPFGGGMLSDATRVSERLRLVDPDTFEAIITLEDPKALRQPVVTRRRYTREPAEINEYVCEENNHNGTDEQGKSVYGR